MSNKKQSSIELLVEQLSKYDEEILSLYEEIEQAKAMHKEEIKRTIEYYHNNMFYLQLKEKELNNITEHYYKQTFGGQNNE